eukprot:m.132363 g.132363  ORF g.132363 m.132363 type:complete len:555 (+) comp14644_c0_seq5:234-1898(+)
MNIWSLTMTSFLLTLIVSTICGNDQPFFPKFHIRPPSGHVNDPNGPFRDPRTGYVHLFMQYCPYGPCGNQGAPIPPGTTPNYQDATHFYSKDLVTWTWTGNQSGVVAGGHVESDTDCPDDHGVYSGSTTIVNGVPTYAYPGVHLNPTPWTDGKHYVTMSQCIATPVDPTDPALTHWKKRTIINSSQIPHGVRQHFHDDSEAFVGPDGRWYIFMGTAACGPKASGDCPFPDPNVKSSYGVNYLFSSEDFYHWRPEHSLVNVSSGFVSCPEFFTLPNMPTDMYIFHSMHQKNIFGKFDGEAVVFHPDLNNSVGFYDCLAGTASKSYWDNATQRRIMWSWIPGKFPCSNPQNLECDSMQSVPREMKYDAKLNTLIINPISEVNQLRESQLTPPTDITLQNTPTLVQGVHGDALDVMVNFSCDKSTSQECSAAILLRVSKDMKEYISVSFDTSFSTPGKSATITVIGKSSYIYDQSKAGRSFSVPFAGDEVFNGQFPIRVLVDTSVIEVYAYNGRAIGSMLYVPGSADNVDVALMNIKGCKMASVEAYAMGKAFEFEM